MARRPVRLLDIANKASAYPNELLADFTSGNLVLIDDNLNEVPVNKIEIVDDTAEELAESANGISGISISGNTITITRSAFLTQHPSVEVTEDTEEEVAMSGGETLRVIDTINRDEFGHITSIVVKNVTLPAGLTISTEEVEMT